MKTEIRLQGLEFFSYHGLYADEKEAGNRFRVNIRIQLDVPFMPEQEDLSHTLDYAVVYKLVKKEMDTPCRLLESLGQRICRRISDAFTQVQTMEIAISKANPAIGGLCEWVTVTSFWPE